MRKRRHQEDSRHYLRIAGDLAFVELTKGMTAVIDAVDVDLVSDRLWKAKEQDGILYALAGRNSEIRMHRVIMNPPDDMTVDHIDGNGLNNRRSNLRICTSTENVRNSKKSKATRSRFKGITRRASGNWTAKITVNGESLGLGTYSTPELAARAYDMAAREYFGKFARPNFKARSAS